MRVNIAQQFLKVPVRGTTAEEVLALWQEGKLYQAAEKKVISQKELIARCRREALAYVAAIDEQASAEWRDRIRGLWERIVRDSAFADRLVIQKGQNAGKLNRYIVTNIVFHLQALDVYRSSSHIDLHKKLERVDAKNSIFKGAREYKLSSIQKKKLRELREDVASQK